jgi:hypothetical protein
MDFRQEVIAIYTAWKIPTATCPQAVAPIEGLRHSENVIALKCTL